MNAVGLETEREAGLPGDPRAEVATIVRWTSWGSLLPFLGWAYGMGLLWTSDHFTRRDKIVGTLLFPGGWFGAFVAVALNVRASVGYCWSAVTGTAGSTITTSDQGCVPPALPPAVGLTLLALTVVAAAAGPVYLRARAKR